MYSFKSRARTLILAIVSVLTMSLLVPMASFAGSKGSRNTAIGLAGAAAYLLIKGKTVPGAAAAIGAGYAYSRSQRQKKEEQSRQYWGRYNGHNNRNSCDNRYSNGRYGNGYRYNDNDRRSDCGKRVNNNRWNRNNHRR